MASTGLDIRPELRRILFVDDEPHLLAGLKRALHSQRNVWTMFFAGSGEEALRLMEETEIDAVVSDMRMPGMDGAELLHKIADRHPRAVRIVMSGHSDEASILSLVGTTHQFLAKPCDTDTLKAVLSRAFALQALLNDDRLQGLVGTLDSLPSLPTVYEKLSRQLQSEHTSLRKIGELIAEDPPMTAKLLQLVNSAFFGLGRRISSPEEAATLLGVNTLKGLLLASGIFQQFDNSSKNSTSLSVTHLWSHSIVVGRIARDIARAEGCDHTTVDDALAAGLLHDIGMLVIAFRLPDAWQTVQRLARAEALHHWDAEVRVLGVTHSAVGAYLLGLWGLPEPVVEAVAFSHTPTDAADLKFDAVTAVHVADALTHGDHPIDMPYLGALGLEHRLAAWRVLSESVSGEAER